MICTSRAFRSDLSLWPLANFDRILNEHCQQDENLSHVADFDKLNISYSLDVANSTCRRPAGDSELCQVSEGPLVLFFNLLFRFLGLNNHQQPINLLFFAETDNRGYISGARPLNTVFVSFINGIKSFTVNKQNMGTHGHSGASRGILTVMVVSVRQLRGTSWECGPGAPGRTHKQGGPETGCPRGSGSG